MPIQELLAAPAGTTQWPVWGTTARLVVTDPDRLDAARGLVTGYMAAVDRACNRFRPDSEVRCLQRAGGRPARVSPLLAELVGAALEAARRTDGAVDPTVGGAMDRLGYDRDLSLIATAGGAVAVRERPAPGWRQVHLDGRDLTIGAGVLLDLGATAKAGTADHCAQLVADRCGVGVLLSLGGDIATAGPAPEGGWRVLVQDGPGEPAATIRLPGGAALATSSTISRRWRAGAHVLHHILDPRTCLPAPPVWRTVSVASFRAVDANTFATAAVVRGRSAPSWLRGLGAPARLVTDTGDVILLGCWPPEGDPS